MPLTELIREVCRLAEARDRDINSAAEANLKRLLQEKV